MSFLQRSHDAKLAHLDRFSSLSTKDIRSIVKAAEHQQLADGAVLADQGAHRKGLYILLRGTADVVQGGEVVRTLGEGDLIGEIGTYLGEASTATVTVAGEAELLFLTPADVTQLVYDVPAFRTVLETTAGRRLLDDELRD